MRQQHRVCALLVGIQIKMRLKMRVTRKTKCGHRALFVPPVRHVRKAACNMRPAGWAFIQAKGHPRAQFALLVTIVAVKFQGRTKYSLSGVLGHVIVTQLAVASMVHSARAV